MRPRRGELLHAGRQVRGLAHGRVVHVQIIPNGAHHHFPGIEADADAQLQPLGAPHLLGIVPHGGLHGQGGIAGPQGVVLVGNGAPKRAMMPSPSTWFTVPS